MSIKQSLLPLILSIIMLSAFGAQATNQEADSSVAAFSMTVVPIPEAGRREVHHGRCLFGGCISECQQIGSNTWSCCEESETEQMSICYISVDPKKKDSSP